MNININLLTSSIKTNYHSQLALNIWEIHRLFGLSICYLLDQESWKINAPSVNALIYLFYMYQVLQFPMIKVQTDLMRRHFLQTG